MKFSKTFSLIGCFLLVNIAQAVSENVESQTSLSQKTSPTDSYRLPMESTGFYTGVDVLLWKVNENGKDFAIRRTTPVVNSIGSGLLGSFHEGEFECQVGVRPWIGYQFRPDYWKIQGTYTFYQTGKTDKVTQPSLATLDTNLASLNTTLNGDLGNATAFAKSSTNFIYNSGDLILAKQFRLSPYLFLTTLAGIKGLWVHQHWHIRYQDVLGNFGKHRLNWKYHGAGPEFGLETEWYFGKGFALNVLGAASFLYGEKTHRQKYTLFLVDSSTNGVFTFQDFDLSKNTTLPTTQLLMTLSWGRTYKNWLEFVIRAGYEINGIYNANEDYRFAGEVNPIDEKNHTYWQTSVFLQGLTAGIDMHF